MCGYPGEERKRYQPWQMEGTISQIIMKEGDHGLIIYKNIDTSRGQSGSMIVLIEDNSKVTDMVDKKSDDLKSYPIVNRVQDVSSHDFHIHVKPKEIRMDGTNIGVHVAGIEGSKNWGTLLTPTIM